MNKQITVVVGSNASPLPPGLIQGLARLENVDVLARVDEWPKLLDVLEQRPPRLLIIDRRFWRAASARRLTPIPHVNRETRILLYCEKVDVTVVGEAVAYGVQGCIPAASTALQWSNAIEVVLRHDVAMPRALLAQALHNALGRRLQDQTPVEPSPLDAAELAADEPLTERERDVIRCVTGGMTNKEIARHLGISHTTVKTHLHHVFGKLKVGRRVMLMRGAGQSVQ